MPISKEELMRKLESGDSEDYVYYGEGDVPDDKDDDIYRIQPFADGIGEYDEYQQAWRYLGYMIDCNAREEEYDDDEHHDSFEGTGEGCKRYVLWAAYVDLEYEGGGIAEYQYYNLDKKKWDTSSCGYADNGNSRCAKMDCHLDSTHFSLLGFFKHGSYDDWMEQLFKHEGVCVWGYDQYNFMDRSRDKWPQGCAETGTYTQSGDPIYYDIKPGTQGNIGVGLYSDTQCIQEYVPDSQNSDITVENILGNFLNEGGGSHDEDNDNYDYSGYSLSDSLALWEYGMDKFKICQPCVAYNLQNVYGANFYDDAYGGFGDNFDCNDEADYTNVNQCMKFMAKTTMNTATFRDLSLARTQGTLVDQPLAGFMGSTARNRHYLLDSVGTLVNYAFLILSIAVLSYGVTNFWKVRRKVKLAPKFHKSEEPLVFA